MNEISATGFGKASQHAVLLIHGLAGSSLEVARLGQILQQSGLAVLMPNIPGFAYGTPVSGWQSWVDAVRAHLQLLKSTHETVSIVGVSMGATLCMEVATHDDVAALVLLAPAMAYDGWAVPWYRFMLPVARYLPFRHIYRYVEAEPFGVKNPTMRAAVKKMLQERHESEVGGESISFDQLAEGDTLIAHVRKRIDMISDPILIMHAADDESVHPRNAQYICDHVSSADKELILLGDCYHMITVDNERDTVFYETEMFVKRSINAKVERAVFDVPQQMTRSLDRLAKWARAAV
jgi:carboxylesterase